MDASGIHGLHCRSVGRHPRHTALNDLVISSLVSIDIPSIPEPSSLFQSNTKCEDDVSIVPWKSGHPLTWDITCCDTSAPTCIPLATSGAAGKVANLAESRKKQLYQKLEPTHYLIWEMDIASKPQSFHQLCQCTSMSMQKFNAVLVMGHHSLSSVLGIYMYTVCMYICIIRDTQCIIYRYLRRYVYISYMDCVYNMIMKI